MGLPTQAEISTEIADRAAASAVGMTQPLLDYPPYRSSILRHPTKDLHHVDPEVLELASPAFGHQDVDPLEADLTIQAHGDPIGERMVVTGRVSDDRGHPVVGQWVEVSNRDRTRGVITTMPDARPTFTSPCSALNSLSG